MPNVAAAVESALRRFQDQSAVMFSAMKHALPPDPKRDGLSLSVKLGYLQRLKDSYRLQQGEERRKVLPYLVGFAGDQDAAVSSLAFEILSVSFPEELESVTRSFESMIRTSLRPVDLGVRFFVSRSPVADKDFLIQYFLNDPWTRWSAADNLLKRQLLSPSDISAIPYEMAEFIAEHPSTTNPLREAIIFCGVRADAALKALKSELAVGGDRDHFRTLILMHRDKVALPVLMYAIEEMGITREEIFDLLGFKKSHAGGVVVDEALAAEIAVAAGRDYSEATAMLPHRPLKRNEIALLNRALDPHLIAVNPMREQRGMMTGDDTRVLVAATKILIEQEMLDADDLAALSHHRNNKVDYVLIQHPNTTPAQLLDVIKRGGPHVWAAYQRAESMGIPAEELTAAALASKNEDIRAVFTPKSS